MNAIARRSGKGFKLDPARSDPRDLVLDWQYRMNTSGESAKAKVVEGTYGNNCIVEIGTPPQMPASYPRPGGPPIWLPIEAWREFWRPRPTQPLPPPP
jgi:hypothetical protein